MSNIQKPSTKPEIQSLPQIKERISFLYLERCIINRADNAITVTDVRGTVYVPAAALSVLMLGPGTKLTHRAMELIGDTGASVIWVGEQGVRYYAHGRPLANSSRLLIQQAALVTNSRSRIDVARRMYSLRFPNEDVGTMSMQQLRGKEGARVRAAYRKESKSTGVPWSGREYDPDNFEGGTPVNKALSAAHACLYGVVHSVIVALGCSPGLGFIHTGHERSFVYDIADLYKAEITIPIAFKIAAEHSEHDDIGAITRRAVRDYISDGRILAKAVKDIRNLLFEDTDENTDTNVEILQLWDDKEGYVKSGVGYAGEDVEEIEEEIDEGYGDVML